MPLTVPGLASRSTRCTVSISSADAGVGFTFTLTPQQVEAWSDQDLLDRIDAFKVGLMGFLPSGADVQVPE
ncbi:hypothetical protein [Streptomyces sp. NRRL F-5135]|uniref:hypothetical protein n=1 Tax=Streptomyces sp. NRRL F-5135 TaxID=1463858 RepID=UPI0004C61DB4|nr:hypothetical protein [Streptomyces sp. NRRL F-5135]